MIVHAEWLVVYLQAWAVYSEYDAANLVCLGPV